MNELEEAIREHLDLKRRRGADAAEVAREEQEALAPVTRSHPVVVAPLQDAAPQPAPEASRNGAAPLAAVEAEPDDEPDPDATQEFLVEHGASEDWLVDDD